MAPRFDKLLVLDLDETLVHAQLEPMAWPAEFRVGEYHVRRRPGLDAFLEQVFQWFAVGIWTASTGRYAHEVIHHIVDRDNLAFVYTRDRCTLWTDHEAWERVWLKDIRKLRRFGFAKQNILVVDDSPKKLRRSYGNLVRATPFEGDPSDRELWALLRYLEHLGSVPNVRTIEKRGWQSWWAREGAR